MADSKNATNSLLTEHFRYTPITLLDDIINTINELVYRAVNAVEEGLLSAPPTVLGFRQRAGDEKRKPELDNDGIELYPEAKREIEEGVHQLETLLEATVDKNFDKLEIWALRNVLTVPDELASWVRLEHYQNYDFNTQTEVPSAEDICLLRRKFNETQKLNAALSAEAHRNALLISQLQALLAPPETTTIQTKPEFSPVDAALPSDAIQRQNPFAFLTSSPEACNLGLTTSSATSTSHQPLTTNTTFALSQMPALHALVEQLQSKLASLSKASNGEREPLTLGEERKVYVEGRMKHMMEGRGVDLQAGLRADRRFRGHELRDLEAIVGEISREKIDEETQE